MKKTWTKLITQGLLLFIFCIKVSAQENLKLWYDKPATDWMNSALPLGNGEFGGMFFGTVEQERIQFNEKTLWKGTPEIRGAYQSFGDLYLDFPSHETYTDYCRELDLKTAVGTVTYKVNGVTYLREYFVSNPDSALIMKISTPGNKGKVSFTLSLKDAHATETKALGTNLLIKGKLDLISYNAQVKVISDRLVTIDNNKIIVKDADVALILLTGATNYNIKSASYLGETESELQARIANRIQLASSKNYVQLKDRHTNQYCPLFERVKFDLGVEEPNLPTDVLIKTQNASTYLDVLYFQYGRYLMLGSSLGMDLPNNLQGIWNHSNNPPWESDIHTNINIQMNYWPAENTNLAECHLPFLNYVKIEAMRKEGSWQKLAKDLACRGWTLNTQSTIFGHTDWNANRPANAWYCMHLWQHYAYTNNLNYLKETAFPVMKSTCEFWFDRLKEDANGKLVAPDEWSPEQGDWEDGVAYAQQLIWELFSQTLKAAEIVKADKEFIKTLKNKFANLDNGLAIGEWGQIREWKIQPDIKGNEHRHLSHLVALYPGNQISYNLDKAYADAAKVTLESRGDLGTGWSRAWKIACWARLFDGDHAYKLLKAALICSTGQGVSMDNDKAGVYENLLDSHPPFQIDGNFGATAGIAEMLLQSNLGFIHLLPALPSAWPQGNIQGLKAEGNFTINMKWEKKKLSNCTIYSGSGNHCTVYYPEINIEKITDENGKLVKFDKRDGKISFQTKKNEKYNLELKLEI